jgi:peptidoglycan/LPS O-acetylase OafA/YrhL
MALLIVIGAHTHPQIFLGGNIGVDLFFVLSGFLITTLLLNEQKTTGSISIKTFYIRRALRLLPALVLLLAAVITFSWFAHPETIPGVLASAKSVIGYYWNWYLSAGWQPQTDRLGHLWSLSVEEQFYVLWPIVLIFTAARPRVFRLILIAGISGPAIGRVLLWSGGPALDLYFRTDLRFDSLMWGALAAWLSFNRKAIPYPNSVGGIAFISYIVLACFRNLSNGFLYLGGYSLIGALGLYLIIAGTKSDSHWLKSILEFRPLKWTGKISYGLYLWHVPIFIEVSNYQLNPLASNAIALAATFAISAASYYGLEMWFLKWKPYSKPKSTQLIDARASDLIAGTNQ